MSGTYGPAGDCWSQGAGFAEDCENACGAAVEDLAIAHPKEAACADYLPARPMQDGAWSATLELDGVDSCALREIVGDRWVVSGDVSNDFETNEASWLAHGGAWSFDLACTIDGADFLCFGGNTELALTGSGDGRTAEGTWGFGAPNCYTAGTFVAATD